MAADDRLHRNNPHIIKTNAPCRSLGLASGRALHRKALAATAASFRVRVVPNERTFHQRRGEIECQTVEERVALRVHVNVNITEFQYVIGRFRLWIESEKIAHARAPAALNTEPKAAIAVVFG